MTLPNLGKMFDRLAKKLLEEKLDRVLKTFIGELQNKELPTLKEFVTAGHIRGAFASWAVHSTWLGIARIPPEAVGLLLGDKAKEWALQVESRALAVYGTGKTPLEPSVYVNFLGNASIRGGFHTGTEAVGEETGGFKQWIRAYPSKDKRDWHDRLNGSSIPVDAQFVLPGGPNAGKAVDGPHDWVNLPSAAEHLNCGHASIIVPAPTREELGNGARNGRRRQ